MASAHGKGQLVVDNGGPKRYINPEPVTVTVFGETVFAGSTKLRIDHYTSTLLYSLHRILHYLKLYMFACSFAASPS